MDFKEMMENSDITIEDIKNFEVIPIGIITSSLDVQFNVEGDLYSYLTEKAMDSYGYPAKEEKLIGFNYCSEKDGESKMTVSFNSFDGTHTADYDIFLDREEMNIFENYFRLAATEQLKEILYDEYKKEWLNENATSDVQEKAEKEYTAEADDGISSFDEFLMSQSGYDGLFYDSYDGFLDNEYQDKEWLANHLTASGAAFLANYDSDFPLYKNESITNIIWKDDRRVIWRNGKMWAEGDKHFGFEKDRQVNDIER